MQRVRVIESVMVPLLRQVYCITIMLDPMGGPNSKFRASPGAGNQPGALQGARAERTVTPTGIESEKARNGETPKILLNSSIYSPRNIKVTHFGHCFSLSKLLSCS